ncbi:hypothetical protein ZP13_24655 [Salmonella enterica subsp. enterica]|nr:hypothetical protein [Salmonella enterica subsp. enterica]ECE0941354.1 hypothetical protein [Salmonella enterica subsp. enterica]ECH9421068.1 hypothetical protein [Salmonella enterica subsp. enterica]ECI2262257.1 hypothetical protein [Salmonella enterica subsp. enterica]
MARNGMARPWHFDPSLVGNGASADISLLENGGQLPGTYLVTIKLNGEVVDNQEVDFRSGGQTHQTLALSQRCAPCPLWCTC